MRLSRFLAGIIFYTREVLLTESKGFMEAVNVTDFPIGDHKVILRIRRRCWTDLSTGKSFSIPIDLNVVPRGPDTPKNLELF